MLSTWARGRARPVIILIAVVAGVMPSIVCSGGPPQRAVAPAPERATAGPATPLPDRGQTPPPAKPLDRGIVIARGAGLFIRDIASGSETEWKRAPDATISYAYPRWSPDGRWIAYVANTRYSGAPGYNWGGNIVIAAVDGTEERALFERPAPGVTADGLAWAPDGRALYAGIFTPTMSDGRVSGHRYTLEQIDVGDGTRTKLVDGGAFPTVSPDGGMIAYIALADDAIIGDLWTANAQGGERRALVAAAMFAVVQSPRWSPDGARIGFAAAPSSGGAGGSGPPRTARRWPWQPRPVAAHGLPLSIWTIPAGGGRPERISAFAADDASPAWSPDGSQIAVITADALLLLPRTRGESRTIGPGEPAAQIDWR